MTLHVEPLTGARLQAAITDLARLRITVFREWPYLYEGTLDYEQGYVQKFAASPGAVIVAAMDDDQVVGAATASPMAGHADQFAEPFRARGFDIAQLCYFGESVLLPSYRGRGIGNAFFDHREAHARTLPGVTHTTFCAVVRPADHPARPADYRPLDAFWRKRGYEPVPGLVGSFSWPEPGSSESTTKSMQFWLRALTP